MNKKLSILFSLAILCFVFQGSVNSTKEELPPKFKYSKKVNTIVQNKCYGCHSTNGKSDKAKKALMWDDVPSMSASDQAHIMEEILEVMEDRAMPPKKMVEMKPELKLTDKEVATFEKWANKMHKRVTK